MGHFWDEKGDHSNVISSCFVTGNRAWQGFRAMENEYPHHEQPSQSQSIQA
jgi:hypothetical protein